MYSVDLRRMSVSFRVFVSLDYIACSSLFLCERGNGPLCISFLLFAPRCAPVAVQACITEQCTPRLLFVRFRLQGSVLLFLLAEAYFRFLPSVWIMFGILLVQGLVEGTEFKSTMFKIYSEVNLLAFHVSIHC